MKWSIQPRLLISLFVAGITSVLLPPWLNLPTRILCIWDMGMLTFLGVILHLMFNVTPAMMRQKARMHDEGRVIILTVIVTAACASILAIGYILHDTKKDSPPFLLLLHLGLSVITIVGSWLLVHTIFTSHYAHAYYQDDAVQGLDFPSCPEPDYWDFLYFSFVIGMTSQVSDVQIVSRSLRRFSLLHAILSFFFNTAILAMSFNIISGII